MTLSNPAQYISGRTVQEQMNSLIDYVDQRAAEVATDAIASDVAQVHSDAADAHTDALAAAASAAAAAGTLANAVKKTGEASQSIAGDIAVAGALSGGSVSSSGNVDGASIGSGATPVVCGDLTAYGNVSLDDTALQGNLSVADPSALINLSGAGSVLVPTPTGNSEAATKKYVDDALDNYAPMVRKTSNNVITGITFSRLPVLGVNITSTTEYTKIAYLGDNTSNIYFAGICGERYGAALIYFNYSSGSPITTGATVETNNVNNISIGIFETSNGEVWLVNKRLASGANRCYVSSLICMRGTTEYAPQSSTDGSTFTDADGTYYEAVQI